MTSTAATKATSLAAWPTTPAGRVALLDVDPELAGSVPPDSVAALRHELTASVYRLPRGPLPPPPPQGNGEVHLGYLLLKGLLLREVKVCGRPTAELLGPGDLVRPWDDQDGVLLPSAVQWTALEQALLADLGPTFASRISGRPQIVEALMSRAITRAHALALERSIASHVRVDVRVLAFLWHLAQRFGVVVPDAVRVDVPLTHSVLARLVGARRPTVTTALQRLMQLGYLRREGRAYTLIGDASRVAELEAQSPSRNGDTANPSRNGDAPSLSRNGDGPAPD